MFYIFSSAKLWDNMMNCQLHVRGNRSLHLDNSYDTPASVWWEGEAQFFLNQISDEEMSL